MRITPLIVTEVQFHRAYSKMHGIPRVTEGVVVRVIELIDLGRRRDGRKVEDGRPVVHSEEHLSSDVM